MEVKKIVEGMTAPQVAQVIDENFTGLNNGKADKKETEISLGINKNNIDFIDITPDYIGKYFSKGGTLTDLDSYNSKVISLSKYVGKYLKLRFGYTNQIYAYCFIKKTNGSYVALSSELYSRNNSYCILYVKSEYSSLDVSWDTKDNPFSFISVMDDIQAEKTKEDVLRLDGEIKLLKENGSDYDPVINAYITQSYTLDVTKKYVTSQNVGYYNASGELKEDDNWRNTRISVEKGKLLRFATTVVPGVVNAISVYDENETLIYRNNFDGLFVAAGAGVKIGFTFFAKIKCSIVLSYLYNDGIYIYDKYDNVGETKIIEKTASLLQWFDLDKPDAFGVYYSEGGVLSQNVNYAVKEINVSNYIGDLFQIRCGFQNDFAGYCFVKLSDGTFKNLSDYMVDQTEDYGEVVIPKNAVSVQLSFDIISLNRVFFFARMIKAVNIKKLQDQARVYFGEKQDLLLSVYSSKWLEGQYWSAGGVLSSHKNYRAKTIDVTDYKGKKLFVSMGFGTVSNPVGYLQYCFLKRENGNYTSLNNLPWELNVYGYYITLPSDAKELQVSYDKYSKYPLEPFVTHVIDGKIDEIEEKVNSLEYLSPTKEKIFLFGDSISSTDYTWYKDSLKKYSGAEAVYNQGASGRNAAYQASNEYFNRLTNNPSDVVVALVGGNDSGEAGSIGTFSEQSELFEMGESVVSETNISEDYSGSKFIQAISHIIRKWKNEFYDFRLKANLSAKIVSSNNTSDSLFVGTEKECLEYARLQGWELGYGKNYFMICTETEESKRKKLLAVKMPKLYFCTTLPQKRYNDSNAFSKPENWERKRLAVIECCDKYGIPCIDLAKEFAIDWSLEPFWPGQGYSSTSKTDNQGIYTMDGLHPNEFGYDWIARIVAKNIK